MPLFEHATHLASYRDAAKAEDRAVVLEQPDRLVVLVADGAGGIVNGGAAADVVVGMVKERAAELTDIESCIEVLKEADQLVLRTGGETTAVLIVIDDHGIRGASCGDSEAWIVRDDGTADDLTRDQHTKKRVGSGRAVPVGFERHVLEGGTLVVGSDGLFRYARREDIVRVVLEAETLEEVAAALVELVRPGSGELLDDSAVTIVRLVGG